MRKRKKSTKVKFYRCPSEGCGVFLPNRHEYIEHLALANHCQFCGFVNALPAETNITTDLFCPACRLQRDSWPGDPENTC